MTFFDDKAYTINDLINAVIAIETELGSLPAGVYASVRTRLDILEARINNPFAPAPNVNNPFYIGGSPVSGVSIQTGFGDPNLEKIPAIPGSLFLREDGYNIQGLYAFRPDGYWHQIDTDPWTACGDLAGTAYCQTVIGIQGRPVSPVAPQTDAEGDGYVLTWDAVDGYWKPEIGFYAAGDLAGNKLSQTLVNIQGNPIQASSPVDGEVLTWNSVAHWWEPQQPAVVFGPLDTPTATNIKANRLTTQSPIDNTQTGIVNFGSRSTGATTGVTASYASILGGDQNQVSGTYSLVVGGSLHNISGSYSNVLGGTDHFISASRATIVGGGANTIDLTGTYASIVSGEGNTIHSVTDGYLFVGTGLGNTIQSTSKFASILNGNGNQVSGQYDIILNGIDNIISGNQSVVLSGNTNTVSSNDSTAQGNNNTIFLNSNFVTVQGDSNSVGGTSAAAYSAVWGSANVVNDGYECVYGYNNSLATGSTYADIHGNANTTGGPTIQYISIWGNGNQIQTNSAYTAIFGATNLVNAGSTSAFVVGTNNHLTGPYTSAWGQSNTVVKNTTGYTNVWGQSNNVTGDYTTVSGLNNTVTGSWSTVWGDNITLASSYSTAYGYYHGNITGQAAFVHGQYGQAINAGQYAHANTSFDGTTAGTAQYSRVVLTGSSTTGNPISLYLDGIGQNILTENNKYYDFVVRILVTDTTTTGVCASYSFNVLAHNEGGLVFDRIDAVNLNDNGTAWVGNNWTGTNIFNVASTNQLTVTIPSAVGSTYPTDARRAVATVEWREIKRT